MCLALFFLFRLGGGIIEYELSDLPAEESSLEVMQSRLWLAVADREVMRTRIQNSLRLLKSECNFEERVFSAAKRVDHTFVKHNIERIGLELFHVRDVHDEPLHLGPLIAVLFLHLLDHHL